MRHISTIVLTIGFLFLGTALSSLAAAPQPAMETKLFSVMASLDDAVPWKELELAAIAGRAPREAPIDLKTFFADMGVAWPEGSSIRRMPSIGRLVVKNTPENLARFEEVLATLNLPPNQIEIEVQFVEFNMEDIDALSRQGMITVEGLQALRQQGKFRLIAAPKVVTQAGQEATVKSVTEYIYPTQFTVEPATLSNTNSAANAAGGFVEPSSFETREVGSILSVMPQVTPGRQWLILTLAPEHVCEPTWKDYGNKTGNASGPMEQPFFHTYSFTTQIIIKDGATVLAGGGMNSRDGKKMVYAFLSARMIDLDGRPLKKTTGEKDIALSPPIARWESVMVTKVFGAMNLFDGPGKPAEQEQVKEVFSCLGIEWPNGSSVTFIPVVNRLVVRNTPQNMAIFEDVLATLKVFQEGIETEVQFVEFDMMDVEALSRDGMLTTDGLLKLRQKGKSRLIAAPHVVTQAGQEATVKGVTEYIYPTEFSAQPATPVSTNSVAGTNGVTNTAAEFVEPGAFETREVGSILSVMPQITTEGSMIILNMSPEHVCEPHWKDYGSKAGDALGPMEQPFFHSYSVTTLLAIRNGATAMIGGGMNSRDGKKVVYAFVSARLIDPEGKPLKKKAAGEKK